MTGNPLAHLTVAQLEAAEDYVGLQLQSWGDAPGVRVAVVAAWAASLRSDPTVTLQQVRGWTWETVEALATGNGSGLGEA